MSAWSSLRAAIGAVWQRGAAAPAVEELPGKSGELFQRVPHDAVVIPPKPGAVITWGVPAEVFALSKALEGFEAEPYLDGPGRKSGTWTIGYGSARDLDGNPVTGATRRVTDAQAQAMAARDLDRAASLVALDFPAGLPPRWWAVAVLTCNNMGRMSAWGPTLREMLRAGRWRTAADQLNAYRNERIKGVLTPSLGLRRRAWAEINRVDDWPALP